MARPRGRPRVEINLELVGQLAGIQCTMSEVSSVLDIPLSTLTSRPDFSLAYKKGSENGKSSLRRIQFKLAQTSAGMAIFLGKNYLGQIDTPLIDQSTHQHYVVFRNPRALKENGSITPRAAVKDAQLSPR